MARKMLSTLLIWHLAILKDKAKKEGRFWPEVMKKVKFTLHFKTIAQKMIVQRQDNQKEMIKKDEFRRKTYGHSLS